MRTFFVFCLSQQLGQCSFRILEPVGSDVECVVCEFVMQYVDRLLENNYTEANIQGALDRVCRMMPKTVKDNCQSFVDQYTPAILVILGNELDPAMVCSGKLNLVSYTVFGFWLGRRGAHCRRWRVGVNGHWSKNFTSLPATSILPEAGATVWLAIFIKARTLGSLVCRGLWCRRRLRWLKFEF